MSGLDFLDAASRQARLALEPRERPWPPPERPWALAATHERALLVHWPVAAAELERLVPPGLELETFAGDAWLGLQAAQVRSLRARGLPPLPGLSSLSELELRTYVSDGERPGIWVISLEASSRARVELAKRTHRLPAYHARVEFEPGAQEGTLEASRDGLALSLSYRAGQGDPHPPRERTLERFVCDRYVLYTADGGRLYRAEVARSPWLVLEARVALTRSSLVAVPLLGEAQGLLAARQDVVLWPLEEVG